MKTQTFHKLEKWLTVSGNSEARLAYLLGYKTTATITAWLKNKRVPRLAEKYVLNVIETKEKK